MLIKAITPRILIVHTPDSLWVLTPTDRAQLAWPFDEVLKQPPTKIQTSSLSALLQSADALPVDIALSSRLLPIHQHPLAAELTRSELRRFLRHHYPKHYHAQGYCVTHANQQRQLLSAALATSTLRRLIRWWHACAITPRSINPLANLLPGNLESMPGTHLLLYQAAFERSLSVLTAQRLHFTINQAASFEDLFRCFTQLGNPGAWEHGINLLDTPTPLVTDTGLMPWLDAWYWFAE